MADPPRKPAQVLAWLDSEPDIAELIATFPDQWSKVRREAAQRGAQGDAELRAYVLGAVRPAAQSRDRARPKRELVQEEVRRRMLLELLRQATVAAETGQDSGTIRFNLLNGTLAQRLFFERDLRRKPVSIAAYRATWPLLWQRNLLLPLVRRKGIYCFYSSRFVKRLAALIGDRPCLEIAAGDGTLTRFLRDRGVELNASDDYSWARHVSFDESVERLDARAALRRHQPAVVVCSWPPPGNDFEAEVFRTPTVETYVVVTSRSRADAGNWTAYEDQDQFQMTESRGLSRLVLPTGRNRVLLFQRIP